MKKHGILNSTISKLLSDLGHMDLICISDCGLPVPNGIPKIDLALKLGEPSFIEVVKIVADDMQIENVTLASEIHLKNSAVYNALDKIFENVSFEEVSHDELKKMTQSCSAVIRTGEATPYANCILRSGVIF